MTELHVTVVVPTYNRVDMLGDCLAAIRQQDYPDYDVIVVDDGSSDGTSTMMRQVFPEVLYLRQDANRGPAVARNLGIKVAQGEIIAFTDDDCRVPVNWLSRLIAGFVDHPEVSGVSGYQEAPDELLKTNVVARADHYRRLLRWDALAHTSQLGGYEVPGFGTNNAAFRRVVLQEIGGFDERFPVAAGEDADLKLRLCQHGYRLLYIPLKVMHYREYTLRAQWRMSVRRGVGVYHFEAKYDRPPSLVRIGLRVLRRTFAFFRNLLSVPVAEATVIYLSSLGDCLGQCKCAIHSVSSNSGR